MKYNFQVNKFSRIIVVLTVFVVFSPFFLNAQVKDSIYYSIKQNSVWQQISVNELTYNGRCLVSQNLAKNYNSATQTWENASVNYYTYNDTGKLIKDSAVIWDNANAVWLNNSMGTTTYKNNGLTEIFTRESWSPTMNKWTNSTRSTISYNDNRYPVLQTNETNTSSGWQNTSQTTINYNAQNQKVSSIFQVWNVYQWVNRQEIIYSYADDGSQSTLLYYLWNTTLNQWDRNFRTVNVFDPASLLQLKKSTKVFISGKWQNGEKESYKYNAINLPVSTNVQYWDSISRTWIAEYKIKQDYYSDGANKSYDFENWDNLAQSWSSGYKDEYTNHGCNLVVKVLLNNNTESELQQQIAAGIIIAGSSINYRRLISTEKDVTNVVSQNNKKTSPGNKIVFSISPNPARNYCLLLFNQPVTLNTAILVTDITGKTFVNKKILATSTAKLDVSKLPAGVYFVTVISGKQSYRQKLIVE